MRNSASRSGGTSLMNFSVAIFAISLLPTLSCRSDNKGPAGPPGPPAQLDPRALLIWRDSSSSGQLRPVVDDSLVYLYSYYHVASAVSKTNGALRWKRPMPVTDPSRGGNGLLLVNGVLVIGDRDLFGVDPKTGSVLWQYIPSVGANPGFLSQTSHGRTLFCGSTTGHVYAVDAKTGTERWAMRVAVGPATVGVYRPVLFDGVVFVAYTITTGFRGTSGVAALDAATGTILWNTPLPNQSAENPSGSFTGVAVVGSFVIAPSGDGSVYGLSRTTGVILRTLPYSTFDPALPPGGQELRFLTSVENFAFLTSNSGRVTALAAADLRKMWSVQLGLGSPTDISADADFVYVTLGGGQLAVSRLSDGSRVWTLESHTFRADGQEGMLATPAIDGDRLYAGGEFEVYAFKRR